MPTKKSWFFFIITTIFFLLYLALIFFYGQMQKIKENWPLYKCNPIYMPLADNIEQNFIDCIQSSQSSFMGFILEPFHQVTGGLTSLMGTFMDEINSVRGMINYIRTNMGSTFQMVFSVFFNIIIEFQKIIIGFNDLVGKTIGIVTSTLYVMDGTYKTINSIWAGPPGQLVQTIGKCFHPDTQLLLKDGTIKKMKNICLGDILEDGSVVEATMKINNCRSIPNSNYQAIPFYLLKNKGIDNTNVYVTGTHFIYDKNTHKFVQIQDYCDAIKTNVTTKYFCCLITSTHRIKIGDNIFWDWEDYSIKSTL